MTIGSRGVLRVRVLNVGQGDAIIVSLPDERKALVVDAFDGECVLRALEEEAVAEVVLFLSHSDKDHVEGVQYLLDNYSGAYKAFIFNRDRLTSSPESDYRTLLRALGQATRAAGVWSGDFNSGRNRDVRFKELVHAPVSIEVLHPTHDEQSSLLGTSTNEASGVLRIVYNFTNGDVRTILLTGDVQLTGLSCMLHRLREVPDKLRADVLKFPHHGAWPTDYPGISEFQEIEKRTLTEFLTAVDPEVVVLSVGLDNNHGHVRREVFNALLSMHDRRMRLKRIVCTQITQTCLRQGDHCDSPACGGDAEVWIGDSVLGGMEVLPPALDHMSRILSLTDRGHAACAPLLQPAGIVEEEGPVVVPG